MIRELSQERRNMMIPRYWRREGYEVEAGAIITTDTTSPGADLLVGHTFGPYEEDTYIRGLAKSVVRQVGGTKLNATLEFYDTTNNVQLDASYASLNEAAYANYDALVVMWEGLLLTGNQVVLTARAYMSTPGGGELRCDNIKAWYEVARE